MGAAAGDGEPWQVPAAAAEEDGGGSHQRFGLVYADYCCSLHCGFNHVEESPVEDLRALFARGLLGSPCTLAVTLARRAVESSKPRSACAVILRGGDDGSDDAAAAGVVVDDDSAWTDDALLACWATLLAERHGRGPGLVQTFHFEATYLCLHVRRRADVLLL